jgi:hypothetical protein
MDSSPSKLYIALIILVGFAAGYIAYGQWLKPGEEVIPPAPVSQQDTLKTFENLKIDFSVLNNAAYKDLVVSGESPVNPGLTGKKDLFAPAQ